MNIFEKKPKVNEVPLKGKYRFMYESFVISTQHELFLLLEEQEGRWAALKFEFLQFKYGYPNDESLGAHPMSQYGLGFYGFFEVHNSPWITKLRNSNRIHPSHKDEHYQDYTHYIGRFKDVTLDVVARNYEETWLTKTEVFDLIEEQLNYLRASAGASL